MPPTPVKVTAMITSSNVDPRSAMGGHRNDGLARHHSENTRMVRMEDAPGWHTRVVAVNP